MKHSSTLKSFSFGLYRGNDHVTDDVAMLFYKQLQRPDKFVNNAADIVMAGLDGRIDTSREFNLWGYDYAISTNGKLSEDVRKRKKEKYISFDTDDETVSADLRNGGITIDMLSYSSLTNETAADEFEEIENSMELEYAVKTIKEINDDYITYEGIDLIQLIKSAVQRVPQAIEKLKEVCLDNEFVGEQVKVILGSGAPLDSQFA